MALGEGDKMREVCVNAFDDLIFFILRTQVLFLGPVIRALYF